MTCGRPFGQVRGYLSSIRIWTSNSNSMTNSQTTCKKVSVEWAQISAKWSSTIRVTFTMTRNATVHTVNIFEYVYMLTVHFWPFTFDRSLLFYLNRSLSKIVHLVSVSFLNSREHFEGKFKFRRNFNFNAKIYQIIYVHVLWD